MRALILKSLAVLAAAIVAISCVHWANGASAMTPPRPMPSLDAAGGWLNSKPLTAQDLRGKVLVVDFWTFSCVNCLRTLPYLRAWADKYRPYGFEVIGVHTPEFKFEGDLPNLQRAVRDIGIDYPVAVDTQRRLWTAWGTRAWPSFYFIDAKGNIRHVHLGEGAYEQNERLIQQLLREAGRSDVPTDLVAPQGRGTQAAAGPRPAVSQESYLGSARRDEDVPMTGAWRIEREFAESTRAGDRMAYRFHARDLHLVLAPSADGKPVRFKVRVDGQAPKADAGSDVNADGDGRIEAHRLYQLVRQSAGSRERLFEIEFLDAGARAYAFTFG